jgi:hypothetical protein
MTRTGNHYLGQTMTTHRLKCWPDYFRKTLNGEKLFELRYDDRGYEVDDLLLLQEYDPQKQSFTGREQLVCVTYVLSQAHWEHGLEPGYVILGLEVLRQPE